MKYSVQYTMPPPHMTSAAHNYYIMYIWPRVCPWMRLALALPRGSLDLELQSPACVAGAPADLTEEVCRRTRRGSLLERAARRSKSE